GVAHGELIGPRDQRAIARYLVMLDRLSVGDIEDNWLLGLLHVLLALFEDALDGGRFWPRASGHKGRKCAQGARPGLLSLEMMLEGPAQLIRVGPLGHLRQRLKICFSA